jgi:hypothetical protein
VGSVLEYGSVCYSGMARTHMLRLERVQYRRIRIALGLMCSTPNDNLGIAPLADLLFKLFKIHIKEVVIKV